MNFEDDYISLKMDGFGDVETDAIISEDALRRARRKKRRRRKRRMKKRLAMHHAHLDYPVDLHETYKNLTEEEVSRRAKWTIVATAGLLLFMCLLLIGITLRMAPIIDEIAIMYLAVDKKSDTSIFLKIPENDGNFSSRSSSFSFREEPQKLRRTVSLEDILYRRCRREQIFVRSDKTRRSAPNPRKHTRRRATSLSSSSFKKKSNYHFRYENDIFRRSSRISHSSSRKSSLRSRSYQDASFAKEELLTKEDLLEYRKRRKTIIVIVGTFCLLAFISILFVIVTLTHRSTTIVRGSNFTLNVTHYTFSADPNILCREGRLELCTKGE